MITLNLLPDIKKEYIKANRTKKMILMIAFIVSVSAIAVVTLAAMYVLGVQKLQISNSQNSIDHSVQTLNDTEDLDKIITIQNQLIALPDLQDTTVATSRLFDYLAIVTPNEVSLSTVSVDFLTTTINIKGTGTDFKSINTFVDTLKNAAYTYTDHDGSTLAFSSVVLGSIDASDEAGFKVAFVFDPFIFDPNVDGLKMTVPAITSTRSQTEKPKSLFDSEEEQ